MKLRFRLPKTAIALGAFSSDAVLDLDDRSLLIGDRSHRFGTYAAHVVDLEADEYVRTFRVEPADIAAALRADGLDVVE